MLLLASCRWLLPVAPCPTHTPCLSAFFPAKGPSLKQAAIIFVPFASRCERAPSTKAYLTCGKWEEHCQCRLQWLPSIVLARMKTRARARPTSKHIPPLLKENRKRKKMAELANHHQGKLSPPASLSLSLLTRACRRTNNAPVSAHN
ncbi:hypothetical protein B0J12DRAFT_642866 [Macrophomina phaseolina]|uniref:Secreted protein n=1 Tax=Macrophomina phaseolina TaxID=35725 RepID=A0ABQ8GSI9_9PEZI|nr:hypothetical protein B0J12DRAFT_642866 [Macrophomina phaseolina]